MFQTIQPKDPRIRPLPYPFLGALSISSDVEFMDFPFFEDLMRFLNTQKKTSLGYGLGLEVTSGFFFYSAHPSSFSYFSGSSPTAAPGLLADRMNEYLQGGWFDANHAYGDFDQAGGFEREHALRSCELLTKLGIQIKVFTNHGGPENIQNVGIDAAYHCGDLPGHKAYHADLMRKHGVRFIWTDSLITPKAEATFSERAKHLFEKLSRGRVKILPTLGKENGSLLLDCDLQDHSRLRGFWRFRSTGINAPNLSSLGHQLRQIDWPVFYKRNNVVIIYQHLGVLHRNSGRCYQAAVGAVRARPEVFLAPFHVLAREFREGRLWVSGLSRLLSYVDMVESTRIDCDSQQDLYYIVHDHVVGQPEVFFQGLTVYIDPTRPFRLCYRGHYLTPLHNGPDETGRYSATVPIRKLPDIWE